jgi:hypothetical protein
VKNYISDVEISRDSVTLAASRRKVCFVNTVFLEKSFEESRCARSGETKGFTSTALESFTSKELESFVIFDRTNLKETVAAFLN